MRLRLTLASLVLPALVLGGCSGDNGPTDVGLDPELVAGIYVPTTLSFDPNGQLLDEVNLLDAVATEVQSTLFIQPNRAFNLLVILEATSEPILASGTFETLADGIRLSFDAEDRAKAQRLLLPTQLDLSYNQAAGTLSFTGEIDAPLSRLLELVPAWADEQLADPLRGVLSVEFTKLE